MKQRLLFVAGSATVCVAGVAVWYIINRRKQTARWHVHSKIRYKVMAPSATDITLEEDNVHLVTSEDEWNKVYTLLDTDLHVYPVLGMDCEWVSGPTRHPVSLLQLATYSGLCVLVRMTHLPRVPQTLHDILTDKRIFKVGVAVVEDAKKLHYDYQLLTRGCVDLRLMAHRLRLPAARFRGLKSLALEVLNIELDKSVHTRAGNWETETLTEEQIEYAALDALIAVYIFLYLVERKLSSVWSVASRDSELSDDEYWQCVTSFCQGIIDCKVNVNSLKQSADDGSPSDTPQPGSSGRSGSKHLPAPTRAYLTRKKPLYHNCQLMAPDGQLLCTCDTKKAQWYMEKGLGTKVCDDPLTIKLKFEPSGRPNTEQNYYIQDKQNMCVVCGNTQDYIRKNIVPHEYRKYFPAVMKDHRSHDVVLLCTPCHQQSDLSDTPLKLSLATRCQAPLSSPEGARFKHDDALTKLKSAAKALLYSGHKIPAQRKQELEDQVKSYFGVDSVDQELLKKAVDMDTRLSNPEFSPHGQKVVEYMIEHEGLVAFERMWRQHFLDAMKPQYLPVMWSVDHSHEELSNMDTGLQQNIRQGLTEQQQTLKHI